MNCIGGGCCEKWFFWEVGCEEIQCEIGWSGSYSNGDWMGSTLENGET